ncbi:MAG: YCF48-related protein [bacterium]
MKTKKNQLFFFLFAMAIFIAAPYGCKKKNDAQDSTPARKKYAWVVGVQDSTSYGNILFSPDAGDTWQRQGEGSAALQGISLFDVWAVDTNIVWAVGSNSSILKTNDGGKTWVRITSPKIPPAITFQSISMAGSNNIWISGESGTVINSKDAGNTWTLFDTNFFHNALMQGIYAINSQTAYVVGGFPVGNGVRGFIARTTDGGQTWDSLIPGNNFNQHEWIGVKAADINHIVVYGGQSYYTFSNDAGATWKNDSVPNTGGGGTGGADINCLAMLDAQTWWGAFDYDGIYITADSGTSWAKQSSAGPGGMWLYGIDYYDRNLAVIVAPSSSTPNGKIIKTSNGGNLWELKYSSRSGLFKVSFIKN